MNLLLHTGHWKFFSPVCVLICRASSSLRANFLGQLLQVQGKGRSPVCVRRCAFRWLLLPYTLVQPGCPHRWLFALSPDPPPELPNFPSDSLGGGVAGLSGLGTTSWRTLVRSARMRAIMNMEALGGGEAGSSLLEFIGSPFTLRSRGATPTLVFSSWLGYLPWQA